MEDSEVQLYNKITELVNKLSKTRGFTCECLIDQNRYIGNDPVGHACFNRTTTKITTDLGTLYICNTCKEMLKKEPERLTYRFIMEKRNDKK
jgi:hypothetical protein